MKMNKLFVFLLIALLLVGGVTAGFIKTLSLKQDTIKADYLGNKSYYTDVNTTATVSVLHCDGTWCEYDLIINGARKKTEHISQLKTICSVNASGSTTCIKELKKDNDLIKEQEADLLTFYNNEYARLTSIPTNLTTKGEEKRIVK